MKMCANRAGFQIFIAEVGVVLSTVGSGLGVIIICG